MFLNTLQGNELIVVSIRTKLISLDILHKSKVTLKNVVEAVGIFLYIYISWNNLYLALSSHDTLNKLKLKNRSMFTSVYLSWIDSLEITKPLKK